MINLYNSLSFKRWRHYPFFWVFLFVFVARILLSFLPSYEVDLNVWRFWSDRMATIGPSSFYSKEIFTDNPPGFLYVFWAVGEIQKNIFPNLHYGSIQSDFLIKLPSNIADLITGLLIYIIIKKYRSKTAAIMGFLFYALNPAIFFNSSVMGQFDGSATVFLLLSIYLLVKHKSPQLAVLAFAIAWAIKPQAIFAGPILGLLVLKLYKPYQWLISAFVFTAATLIIYLPFFPKNPLYGLYYVNKAMTAIFTCTSCFTFNFWGIFGNWNNDTSLFLNLPLMYWGFILLSLSYIPIFFFKPFSKRFHEPYLYFTAAVSIMASFIFLTRMHERYIFPFFAFFLIAAILLRSKLLILFYIIFSLFNFINLYFPYAYYNAQFTQVKLTPILVTKLSENFTLLSAVGFFIFLVLLGIYLKILGSSKKISSNE